MIVRVLVFRKWVPHDLNKELPTPCRFLHVIAYTTTLSAQFGQASYLFGEINHLI